MCQADGAHVVSPPVKTTAPESLMSFSGGQHFTRVVTTHRGGTEHVLCDSTGKGPSDPCTCFPQTSPQALLPLVDGALPPFAVIKHSCEHE